MDDIEIIAEEQPEQTAARRRRRTFEEKKADLLKAQVDIAVKRLDRVKERYRREREEIFASLSGEVFEAVKADARSER